MTLAPLNHLDDGDYDVITTNACGQNVSESARLVMTADCLGDIDGDGFVGLQDLSYLLARFEESGSGLGNEDADADDDIDLDDLALLLGRFGSSCP